MHKQIRAYADRGNNMRPIQAKVQRIEPLLKKGKIKEAEAMIREIIEQTK